MESDRFVRWAGAAGMLGGALWSISTVMHALRPLGCVAEECSRRPMRQSSIVEGVLNLAALLLFAVTAAALILLVRRAGRFGKLGKAGTILALAGIATLIVSGLVQALAFDGDFLLMPYFVIPGIAALVIGLLLLAAAVLRSGVLPRWAAVALFIGALAMLGFNEQTHRAWLALPFGLAWIAVGYALWVQPRPAITNGAVNE